MKLECPMGHTRNLSYDEVEERLKKGEFQCPEEDCSKNVSLEVDERFWKERVNPYTKW